MKQTNENAPIVQTLSEAMPQPFIDKVNSTTTIYGWAPLGTEETEHGWRLMKEVVVGNVTKRLYANGSMGYNFAWSERATYTYSR